MAKTSSVQEKSTAKRRRNLLKKKFGDLSLYIEASNNNFFILFRDDEGRTLWKNSAGQYYKEEGRRKPGKAKASQSIATTLIKVAGELISQIKHANLHIIVAKSITLSRLNPPQIIDVLRAVNVSTICSFQYVSKLRHGGCRLPAQRSK